MQCGEFECRFQLLLDRRMKPEEDAQLLVHAARCESCNSMLHAQRELLRALVAPLADEASGDFALRVLRDLPARRVAHRRKLYAVVLATAATLLVTMLPVWRGPSPTVRLPLPAQGAIAMTQRPRTAPQPLPSQPDAEELKVLIRQLLASLSDGRLQAHVNPLTDSIRPLATTFNLAFDVLWRTLPGNGAQHIAEPQARFLVRLSVFG